MKIVAVTVWQDRSVSHEDAAPWIVDEIDAAGNSNTVQEFTVRREAVAFGRRHAKTRGLVFDGVTK